MDSEAGDHASVSPAARTAPFTFGPRASSSTVAQPVQQRLAEAPAVGGLDPAAEADRGGGDDDVGGLVDQFLGGGEEFAVVGERHDPQGGRVQDGGAAPLQQGAELVRPPCGGHPDGEAREGPVPVRSVAHVRRTMALVPLLLVVHAGRTEPANDRVTGSVHP